MIRIVNASYNSSCETGSGDAEEQDSWLGWLGVCGWVGAGRRQQPTKLSQVWRGLAEGRGGIELRPTTDDVFTSFRFDVNQSINIKLVPHNKYCFLISGLKASCVALFMSLLFVRMALLMSSFVRIASTRLITFNLQNSLFGFIQHRR